MTEFKFGGDAESRPDSPEALFRELRPRDRDVRDLYLRQGDLLRAYVESGIDASDIALELPTGAGKTLVGLLIAEWRRRARAERVAYLCPTVQLARQVARKAEGYGIAVSTLVRSQARWDQADWHAFVRGRRIAVTTYSAVFNSNPKLDSAQTLVLDDAHAGEGPVAELWSIRAARDEPLYAAIIEALRGQLPPEVERRILSANLSGRHRRSVDLISPLALRARSQDLVDAVEAHSVGHNSYASETIGDRLVDCLLFVSWEELLIRPLVAPTLSHAAFADARHRVYMSATLGSAGELERSFGVRSIRRPRIPTRDDELGFGRRLFLMPEVSHSRETADEIIKRAVDKAGRAVLLAQSGFELENARDSVVADGMKAITAESVESDPAPFVETDRAVLLLANRYDGIDLPDQTCRMIVLSGLPRTAHLQERFLTERLGAQRVLGERVRTRLTQGSGRCTRNPQDFAVVFLRGADLVDFVSRDEELAAMRPELQAELDFGLVNSENSSSAVAALVDAVLDNTDSWRAADQFIGADAARRERRPPAGTAALERAAPHEVECWQAIWRGDTKRAVELAQAAVDALSGGDELRPYRGLWLYLAASWARTVGNAGDVRYLELAERLQSDAEKVAHRLPWAPSHPGVQEFEQTFDVDERAVRATEMLVTLGVKGPRFERALGDVRKGLASDEASAFEKGLKALGELLGFEAAMYDGTAAPDGAWRANGLWIVWEAKTAEKPENALSVEAVRQAASHATWIEAEGTWTKPDSVTTVLVSPKSTIDPAAARVATDERLVSSHLVRSLADETFFVYRKVRSAARGLDDLGRQQAFARLFRQRRLDTLELLVQLRQRKISDG